MTRPFIVGAMFALLLGCNPLRFDDLQKQAGVKVLEAPSGYPKANGFGMGLAAWAGTLDGTQVSRIAVSAGPDSPYLIWEAWRGDSVGLENHLFEGCQDPGDCESSAGTALTGFPVWRAGSASEQRVCLLVTAPDGGALRVRCETGGGGTETHTSPTGVGFGASAAGFSAPTGAGVAVIGAPGGAGGAGELYRLPDGAGPVLIDLPTATAPANGGLGSAIAAFTLSSGVRVAAGAPAGGRVVVLDIADDGTATVRACLDHAADGWGGALALADLDGDGAPEVIVGTNDAGNSPAAVEVYPGTGLPTPGCVGWDAPATPVLCPDGLDGLDCAGSDYGQAVTAADLDGDGSRELIVGAPGVSAYGKSEAGALFVFGGSGLMALDALTLSSAEEGDRLGELVAAVPTVSGVPSAREEPVAAAPGRNAVVTFLCSGVDGDTPAVGERCIPE